MRDSLNDWLVFFSEFLRHPRQVQSVAPSSRFLRARIVEASRVSTANVVVELGPGTGGITRALLEAMPAHARLISVEINELFHSVVSRIDDGRHIAHLGSAEELGDIIADYGQDAPDAIVSGIPFSAMSWEMGSRIIQAVATQLAPNGRFVAYQVRDRVAALCSSCFAPGRREIELLNIPPMRVFQWHKRDAGPTGLPQAVGRHAESDSTPAVALKQGHLPNRLSPPLNAPRSSGRRRRQSIGRR